MQISHALLMLVLLYTNLQLIISSFVQHKSQRIDTYYFCSHFLSFYLNQIDNTTTTYTNSNGTLIVYQKPLGKTYSKISSLSIILSCIIQKYTNYYSFDVSAYYLTDPTSVVHVNLTVSQVYFYAILKFSTVFVCESFSRYLKFVQLGIMYRNINTTVPVYINPGANQVYFVVKGITLANISLDYNYNDLIQGFCGLYQPNNSSLWIYYYNVNDYNLYITGYCILLYTNLRSYNRQFLLTNIYFCKSYSYQNILYFQCNKSELGTDLNRCILGLYYIYSYLHQDITWLYDLDPKIGFTNSNINVYQINSNILCLQDYQCPSSHPYKMENKSCYDCSQGHIYPKQMIDNKLNTEQIINIGLKYLNKPSILQIEYSYATGEILSICSAQKLNLTNDTITVGTGYSQELFTLIVIVSCFLLVINMAFLIPYVYFKCARKVIVRKQLKYQGSNDFIFQS